ncbi:MAG TPA: cyclic-phosphate processing receiver domain-containing protein [Tepidisphaeraceae bacterium]|jgi:hypothetical protein|nr:cyclic-phosphate processing receiver domain-containing protein [Tepidisphaeraceae bacterium]
MFPPNQLIFILEDNPDRLVPMYAVLHTVLPNFGIHIENDCNSAISFLRDHKSDIALISLDHDLDSVSRDENPPRDHGCGRPVADYLASQLPTCPVIIHTSNAIAGDGMFFALKRAGWPVFRVYPRDHHEWIEAHWALQVTNLKLMGWIE